MQRGTRISKMALELTEDRRDSERRERNATIRLETVDRPHQPKARDLEQIVERLGAVAVASRELARERHVAPHQFFARAYIPPQSPTSE
jgi:hypothetical protein